MECVDAIKIEWTPDVCKVTNVHKTYIMGHFKQRSEHGPSMPDYTPDL